MTDPDPWDFFYIDLGKNGVYNLHIVYIIKGRENVTRPKLSSSL